MIHIPVLCQEIIDIVSSLKQRDGETLNILDGTFGRGGHSTALLNAFCNAHIRALDRDPQAIEYAATHMKSYGARFSICQGVFSELGQIFAKDKFHAIILDFGVSSPQLDDPLRGFSFIHEGPLDMRMSQEGETAADIVNTWPEKDLADLFYRYGGERDSRRIARAIVFDRQSQPFVNTSQLSGLLQRLSRSRLGKKKKSFFGEKIEKKHHPATRVFQALRIQVNRELEEIECGMRRSLDLLQPDGILITIAFHSLEDRLAKEFFKTSQGIRVVLKKPLRPCKEEVLVNPRSRSACLRYGVRQS